MFAVQELNYIVKKIENDRLNVVASKREEIVDRFENCPILFLEKESALLIS